MQDVLVHETASFQCVSSPDTNIVWLYQKHCGDFDNGLYSCSSQVSVAVGNQQYETHINAPGEHSLLINSVTKNMTGLYSCANDESGAVIDSVLLNVICECNFMFPL